MLIYPKHCLSIHFPRDNSPRSRSTIATFSGVRDTDTVIALRPFPEPLGRPGLGLGVIGHLQTLHQRTVFVDLQDYRQASYPEYPAA